jgi:hypothetical protein
MKVFVLPAVSTENTRLRHLLGTELARIPRRAIVRLRTRETWRESR